jgi:DNA-binding response OmpR family regulator
MESILAGRKILIVEGLTLTSAEIREVLANEKAQAFVARDVAAAFRLLDRVRFDAVLIDHSLHNEAIDLCIELRTEGIPPSHAALQTAGRDGRRANVMPNMPSKS